MPNAETKDCKQWTFDDYVENRARFAGPVDVHKDFERLTGQIKGIYDLMKDGVWRTLQEIEFALGIGFPQSSVSAQLRNLRKSEFGSNTVNKRRRNNAGTWEYQLITRTPADCGADNLVMATRTDS